MTHYLSNKIKTLSFYAILLVVFLHSYNLDLKQNKLFLQSKGLAWVIENFFSFGVTRIAVPMFFIFSGFLFFYKSNNSLVELKAKIKKRFRTLVVPYFFWVLFGVFFYFLLQSFPKSESFFTKKLIRNYNLNDWANIIFNEIIPYQLWFLRDLIILTILSPIIYWFIKRTSYLFLITFFFIWLFTIDNLLFTSEAIFFFSVGSFISINKINLLEKKSLKPILFIIPWIIILFLKIYCELIYGKTLITSILLKVSILIGLFAIWFLYDFYKEKYQKNPLSNYSNMSFFIYVFHEPIFTIIKKILFFIWSINEYYTLLIYFVSPIITIVTAIIIGKILIKFTPNIYFTITGNRK